MRIFIPDELPKSWLGFRLKTTTCGALISENHRNSHGKEAQTNSLGTHWKMMENLGAGERIETSETGNCGRFGRFQSAQ
jgi:hypothetical protein